MAESDYKVQSRNFKDKQLAIPVADVTDNPDYVVQSRNFKDKQLATPVYVINDSGGSGGDTTASWDDKNTLTINGVSVPISNYENINVTGHLTTNNTIIQNTDEEYFTQIETYQNGGAVYMDSRYTSPTSYGVEIGVRAGEEGDTQKSLGFNEEKGPYFDPGTGKQKLALQSSVDKKAPQTALDTTNANVTANRESIEELATSTTNADNDLQTQIDDLSDLVTAQQAQIDDLITRVTALENPEV